MLWRRGLVVLALAAGFPAAPAAAGGAVVVQARFEATMPDRFGLDADGDGLIDLPNSTAYVNPGEGPICGPACGPLFTLRLDAGASKAEQGGTALPATYRWEIDGPGGRKVVRRSTGPELEVALPEGQYRVALEVEAALPWGTARDTASAEVAVEDLLVVAIGDSYASGEGNPERPRSADGTPAQWADAPGDAAVEAAHAAAHRSTVAWPALAALALEEADRTTSVTFVSVASTAARIDSGLLAPLPGLSQSQIDDVAALVGSRHIDLLLVAVGGNDIGFARIVRGLVDADHLADPVCYGTDLENVWQSALDGDWNRGSGLRLTFPRVVGCHQTHGAGQPVLPGLQGLPAALDRLDAEVERRLGPGAVYLLAYPDPTGGPDGAACPEIVGDVTPPFGVHEIDRTEQAEAVRRVLQPLNEILAEGAARHGWGYLDGAAASFAAGHGYCGSRPEYPPEAGASVSPPAAWLDTTLWYRHPRGRGFEAALSVPGVAWFRTAAQAVALQGPAIAWDATGTLHPNELGSLALAQALLSALASHPG